MLKALCLVGIVVGLGASLRAFPIDVIVTVALVAGFGSAYWQLSVGSYLASFFLLYVTLVAGYAGMTVWMPETASRPMQALTGDPVIEQAAAAASIVVFIMAAIITWFGPSSKARWALATDVPRHARKTAWAMAVIGTLLMAVNQRGALITNLPYPFNSAGSFDAGVEALSALLLGHALVVSCAAYGKRRMAWWLMSGLIVFDVVFFQLLQGGRALAMGTGLCALALFHMASKGRSRNLVSIAGLAVLIFFITTWSTVRWLAPEMGLISAVTTSTAEVGSMAAALDARQIQMISQSFEHLVWTIDLYETGIRRSGATYMNLIPQATPLVIAEQLGWERPPHDAELLAEYRPHGGGLYVAAEAYWNFGLLGVCLISAFFGVLIVAMERHVRRVDVTESLAYSAFLVYAVPTVGYGVQGFARVMEIALILTLLLLVARHLANYSSLKSPVRSRVLKTNSPPRSHRVV